MEFLKKEWKLVLMIVWLACITIFLFSLQGQISQLQKQNAKIASTLDSVESVVITTDSSIANVAKTMEGVESHVSYIFQKVRRR